MHRSLVCTLVLTALLMATPVAFSQPAPATPGIQTTPTVTTPVSPKPGTIAKLFSLNKAKAGDVYNALIGELPPHVSQIILLKGLNALLVQADDRESLQQFGEKISLLDTPAAIPAGPINLAPAFTPVPHPLVPMTCKSFPLINLDATVLFPSLNGALHDYISDRVQVLTVLPTQNAILAESADADALNSFGELLKTIDTPVQWAAVQLTVVDITGEYNAVMRMADWPGPMGYTTCLNTTTKPDGLSYLTRYVQSPLPITWAEPIDIASAMNAAKVPLGTPAAGVRVVRGTLKPAEDGTPVNGSARALVGPVMTIANGSQGSVDLTGTGCPIAALLISGVTTHPNGSLSLNVTVIGDGSVEGQTFFPNRDGKIPTVTQVMVPGDLPDDMSILSTCKTTKEEARLLMIRITQRVCPTASSLLDPPSLDADWMKPNRKPAVF